MSIKYLLLVSSILCLVQSEGIKVYVNKVFPFANPHEGYNYYKLPYCVPKDLVEYELTLAEKLSGVRKQSSLINIEFAKNVNREVLCNKVLNQQSVEELQQAIRNNYYQEIFVNDYRVHDIVGLQEEEKYFLKTHQKLLLVYYEEDNTYTLSKVEFEEPKAEDFTQIFPGAQVHFSYSVSHLLTKKTTDHNDHVDNFEQDIEKFNKYPLLNTFLFVFSLEGLIYILFTQVLSKENLNQEDIEQQQQETSTWKMIRTEALLPPSYPFILSLLVGSGIQLIIILTNALILGFLGIHYGHIENLKTLAIVMYSLTGFINGFYSASFYKYVGGRKWGLNIIFSTVLLPGTLSSIFLTVNYVAFQEDSISYIPFNAVSHIFFLWILVFIPLTFIGGLAGRISTRELLPNIDNQIPRVYKLVPQQEFTQSIVFQSGLAGLSQFLSIFQILRNYDLSLWNYQSYHQYGFVLVVCESIFITYLRLANLNYRWWWQAFWTGASLGVFIFLYQTSYYLNSQMSGITCYFFSYSIIISGVVGTIMGAISLIASQKFVSHIYTRAKGD